jgi:hypothetical protein
MSITRFSQAATVHVPQRLAGAQKEANNALSPVTGPTDFILHILENGFDSAEQAAAHAVVGAAGDGKYTVSSI